MIRTSSLVEQAAWSSPHRPAALLERVRERVEPLDEGFTLMHRLSGGGIVVRSLRAPPTRLPLFGKVDPAGFRVALVPDSRDISPFQPIVRARIMPAPGGSRVEATLRPHPDARTHALAFLLLAAVLILASMVRGLEEPGFALVGYGFAAVAAAFPGFRARWSFRRACLASRSRLEAELGLVPAESPVAEAEGALETAS